MIRNEISTGAILTIVFAGAYMAISTIWGSELTSLGKMTYTNTVLIFLAVLVFGVVRGGNYIENYIADRSSEDND
jgi:4-hydroxybenzoate polyprenyltransferase